MGIVGAVGAIASSAVGAATSHQLNNKNREFQREMLLRQQEFERERFRAQTRLEKELTADERAYNEAMYLKYQSPEAMLEQYKDAGLNPSLLYGGMSFDSPEIAEYGNIQALSSPQAPSMPQFDTSRHFADIAQNLVTLGQQALNRQSVENDTKRADFQSTTARAQALKYLAERDLIDKKTYGQELENIFNESSLGNRVLLIQKNVDEANQRIAVSQQSISESLSRMNVNEAKIGEINSNISLISQNISNLKLSADKLRADTFKSWAEGKTEVFRRENVLADTMLKESSRSLADARKQLVNVERELRSLGIPKAEVDAFLAPIRSVTEIIGNVFSFKDIIK